MDTYPRFEYGQDSPQAFFDFNVWPFSEEIVPKATTFTASAPGADVGSDTEHVANHILTNDFIYIDVRLVVESDIDDFFDWWNEVTDGQEWTYYPDKDDLGTSHTVIEVMGKFAPKQKDGLYSFKLKFLVIA